jgi:hypothetical protein
MKFRQSKPPIDEGLEEDLARNLRELSREEGSAGPPPQPDAYWSNLLVRTNERIDDASSGKALTISWAARVAIPGVIAILSFLVGLHYFVPYRAGREPSLQAVVLSLPARTMDTLLLDPSRVGVTMTPADIGIDPFEPSRKEISEYLFAEGAVSENASLLSDDQMTEVLARLSTGEK